ncbi:MAG: hypothetical protein HYU36_09460 [Planctomycetes bacterium]|nr:hypothetical protein [Planctomycetota bacterium]
MPVCYLALLIGGVSAEPNGLASEPSADLVLQAFVGSDFSSRVGVSPERAAAEKVSFLEEDGRRFVRLAPLDRKASGEAVAAWSARGLLSNAQGAVSFHVRFPGPGPEKPGPEAAWALLQLGGTSGGEWTLRLEENAEPPADSKKEDKGPELPSSEIPGDRKKEVKPGPGLDEAGGELSDADKPVGSLRIEVRMKLFAEGGLAGSLSGSKGLFQRSAWHHVVWTWRSVWHFLYVDGRPIASGMVLSRMQPIASDGALLSVMAAPAEISDLRIHRRALEPEDVQRLAPAAEDLYLPPLPPLRLWADWGPGLGRAVVYADTAALPAAARVDLACVEAETGKIVAGAAIAWMPSGLGEETVQVTQGASFAPGLYRFEGAALDAQARAIFRSQSADWTAPALTQPWLGCRAGLEKKVRILPPFTPIEVQADAVRTVLREHRLDRTGFFRSLVSAGEELLAGPAGFEVRSGGRILEFSAGPGLGPVQNLEDAAEWSAEVASAQGHLLRVRGRIEYDGVARFDVSLIPKGVLDIERAEFRIPLRAETLRYLHSIATGFIHRFMEVTRDEAGVVRANPISWSVGMPKEPRRRPGVLFDSNDLHETETRFRFTPFIHVGNESRGLCWFADNDRGWIHDPGAVPPLEVVASESGNALRFNVVARHASAAEPLEFRFYLLANPFKPMPEDWQTWVLGNSASDAVARRSLHRWWWHWDEYAQSYHPYPGGVQKRTYEDWIGRFKEDGILHAPFINFGVPGGSGLYAPPHFIEMARLPYTWKLHTNRLLQEYMVYWLDRCVREIGIRGVYVDEPYDQPSSYNVLACEAAYIRPDGTRGAGYTYSEGREYLRRIKQMFADHGLDHSLWVHTSSWKGLPMLTFADMSMDGEWPAIWVESFSNYHTFYNPAKSRAYLSGLPFGFVGAQMLHANVNPKTFPDIWLCARTYLGVTLACSVLPFSTNIPAELQRVQNLREAFGLFDSGIRELRIGDEAAWLPGSRFEPGLKMGGSLNPGRRQALLYLFSHGATASRFVLAGGFDSLGLGAPHAQAWNAETGVSLRVDASLVLDKAPEDTAIVWVRGTDAPQKPRPDGVILGVCFDSDFEPDFGGGMVPVTCQEGKPQPERVPGRSGRAIAVGHEESAVGYPVVPSWVCGSVEFDLQMPAALPRPLRLLALRHHLELSVSCGRAAGRPSLLLASSEVIPGEKLFYGQGLPPTEERVLAAPLPGTARPGSWTHVVLAWRSGVYDLYADGERVGRLFAPAAARLRDAAAPAFGVWIGDGNGGADGDHARAAIDSLRVYDWAFRPEDAARAAARTPAPPAARPDREDSFPVRIWSTPGKDFTHYLLGIHLAQHRQWEVVSSVRFTLFDVRNPESALGRAELQPWFGTGLSRLTPLEASLKVADAARMSIGDEDSRQESADEEEEESEPGKTIVLRVELLRGQDVIAVRQPRIETGLDGPSGEF